MKIQTTSVIGTLANSRTSESYILYLGPTRGSIVIEVGPRALWHLEVNMRSDSEKVMGASLIYGLSDFRTPGMHNCGFRNVLKVHPPRKEGNVAWIFYLPQLSVSASYESALEDHLKAFMVTLNILFENLQSFQHSNIGADMGDGYDRKQLMVVDEFHIPNSGDFANCKQGRMQVVLTPAAISWILQNNYPFKLVKMAMMEAYHHMLPDVDISHGGFVVSCLNQKWLKFIVPRERDDSVGVSDDIPEYVLRGSGIDAGTVTTDGYYVSAKGQRVVEMLSYLYALVQLFELIMNTDPKSDNGCMASVASTNVPSIPDSV